jgi:hypothetical protein
MEQCLLDVGETCAHAKGPDCEFRGPLEVELLRAEVERLTAALDAVKELDAPKLVRVLYESERVEATMEGFACRVFSEMVSLYFSKAGGINYVEMTAEGKETGPILVTFQRTEGKTPHQLKKEAEAERDSLKATIHDANEALMRAVFGGRLPEQWCDDAPALGTNIDQVVLLLTHTQGEVQALRETHKKLTACGEELCRKLNEARAMAVSVPEEV